MAVESLGVQDATTWRVVESAYEKPEGTLIASLSVCPLFLHNKNKSSMKNIFNSIALHKPQGNLFDLTHDVKLSLNMGELIPVFLMDCLPGDRVKISCENVMRLAPMIAPLMHRVNVYCHYFFVPNRILWGHWEQFITGNYPADTGGTSESIAPPYLTVGAGGSYGRLANYLGLPRPDSFGGNADQNGSAQVSALPYAAYQKIYDEYYRDQNLVEPLVAPGDFIVSDGSQDPNAIMLNGIRTRAWEHDYFTACLPFAQKGASVTIPFSGTDVPVRSNRSGGGTSLTGTPDNQALGYVPSENPAIAADALYADASSFVGSATMNDLRRAEALQKWLEANARGGTRYTEHIKHMFGVFSSDKRLQRPEYITGISSPITISEVLNTTGTTELPQGNMSGHGLGVMSGYQGSYFCEEHGWIMGILSVLPKTAYQQGIPRMFSRESVLDYAWPQFANIGEQEVLRKEVYGLATDDDETFGYLPRYSEYKYMPSRVAGDFQTTLDFWHMGRIFAAPPVLNQSFVEADPTSRIFAVEDESNKLWAHHLNKVQAFRLLPKYGTPKLG